MLIDEYLVLQKEDVLKVDFGVHVRGRIVDSAFTMSWDPTYDKLLEAVKAATNTGIRVRSIPSEARLRRGMLTFFLRYRKQELTYD